MSLHLHGNHCIPPRCPGLIGQTRCTNVSWTGHSPCPLGLWLTLHLYECLHECVVCMHGFFARLDLSDQNCKFSLKPNDALHNNLSLVGELRTVTFPSSIHCFSIRESIFCCLTRPTAALRALYDVLLQKTLIWRMPATTGLSFAIILFLFLCPLFPLPHLGV